MKTSTNVLLMAFGTLALLNLSVSSAIAFTIDNGSTVTSAQKLQKNETGTIAQGGSLVLSEGTKIAISVEGDAKINNDGRILQQGSGRAIRDDTGGLNLIINNGVGALIETADADVIQMNKKNSSVIVHNYGSLVSKNVSAGGSQAIDFNAITESGGNVLYNYSTGTITANEADAVRPGINGRVYNMGLIVSTNNPGSTSSSDGVDLQANTGVTIVNGANLTSEYAVIEGARHGITGGNKDANTDGAFNLAVTNEVDGIIRGMNGAGMNIDGFNSNELVTIINHGLISGDGITADGDGVDVDGIVHLENTGTIISYHGNSNNSEGISIGGGTVINSGLIEGKNSKTNLNGTTNDALGRGITIAGVDKDPATGVDIGVQGMYADTSITNWGTIKGDDSAIALTGAANDFVFTLQNVSGALVQSGGDGPVINTGLNTAHIVNAGSIVATLGERGIALQFRGQGNTLTLESGSVIVGRVLGAGLGDSLVLGGDQASSFDVSLIADDAQYQGFSKFQKTGQSTWSLTGHAKSAQNWSVEAGVLDVKGHVLGDSLVVQGGATLTGSGVLEHAVNVNDYAVLSGNQGQTLEMESLSLSQHSVVNVSLGGLSTAPLFKVNGQLSLAGILNVSGVPDFGLGTYQIFTAAKVLGDITLSEQPSDVSGYLMINDSSVNYIVNSGIDTLPPEQNNTPPKILYWNHDSTIWSSDTTNWADPSGGNEPSLQGGQNLFAIFDGKPETITVVGNVEVNGLQFASDGYVLNGDGITFSGENSVIRVGNGDLSSADYRTIISAPIKGLGQLVKDDYGELVLNSLQANDFSGDIQVKAGKLVINTDLANANVAISNGAVLGGNATLANLLVESGATVSPGNSPGLMNITGNLAFEPNSVYEVDVDPYGDVAGHRDQISVSGRVLINGGSVVVRASEGVYEPNTDYTILIAGGGIDLGQGQGFSSVTSNLAFLDPFLTYGLNTVTLTLKRNQKSFESMAKSVNQRAAAQALQTLDVQNPLNNSLWNLATDQVPGALDSLSGEIHAAALYVVDVLSQQRFDTPLTYLRQNLADPSGDNVWVDISAKRQTSEGGFHKLNSDSTLFSIGFDTPVNQDWRVGAAFNYTNNSSDINVLNSNIDMDSYSLMMYMGRPFKLNDHGVINWTAGLSYTQNNLSTKRLVSIAASQQNLTSDYKIKTTQLYTDLGYGIALDTNTSVEPFVSLAWVENSANGFQESGGIASLQSDKNTGSRTNSTVGLRFKLVNLMDTQSVVNVNLAWRSYFNNNEPSRNVNFEGSQKFTVRSNELAQNSFILGLRTQFDFAKSGRLGIEYQGQFGSSNRDNTIKVNANWRF